MPADPADVPPPEWASRAAEGFFRSPRVTSDAFARLLASVREAALREAATLRVEYPGVVHGIDSPCDACQFAYTMGSLDAACAIHKGILALLHTPPSGGGA